MSSNFFASILSTSPSHQNFVVPFQNFSDFSFSLLKAILLISALNLSSCERNAFKTAQRTLNVSLLSNTSAADIFIGTTIGIIIYPYFFSSDFPLWKFLITRPTDCTTSTCEFRGERNIAASNDGTSIPSDKQRTLHRTRHSSALYISSDNHDNNFDRSMVFIEPSICLPSTNTLCSFASAQSDTAFATSSICLATFFEDCGSPFLSIFAQNAIALCIILGSLSQIIVSLLAAFLARPLTHPTNLLAKSKLYSLLSASYTFSRISGGIWNSLPIVKTKTL